MKCLKNYRYKCSTNLLITILIILYVSRLEAFQTFLLNLSRYGYIGSFFAGILFISSFTVAIGAAILLGLAERISPLEIGIFAGLGAVVGDFAIFRFIKDNLLEEITPIYNLLGGRRVTAVLHSKYLSWTLPLIGAIIIASPFPDELGIGLMGISKIKTYQFLILSFILNSIGIFIFTSAIVSVKH